MPTGDVPSTMVHDGVEVPTRGARAWTLAALALAIAAVWVVVLGVVGMGVGAVAHLKGDRWGMTAAVLSGITTIVGMVLIFQTR